MIYLMKKNTFKHQKKLLKRTSKRLILQIFHELFRFWWRFSISIPTFKTWEFFILSAALISRVLFSSYFAISWTFCNWWFCISFSSLTTNRYSGNSVIPTDIKSLMILANYNNCIFYFIFLQKKKCNFEGFFPSSFICNYVNKRNVKQLVINIYLKINISLRAYLFR